ncbi:hypothetical protein BURKHO8Y_340004 [Burkholderia sp. 8Y]|nr:hypothetical protein BURKHO8Y_340004 [Burkholderia sp. 8Y]
MLTESGGTLTQYACCMGHLSRFFGVFAAILPTVALGGDGRRGRLGIKPGAGRLAEIATGARR